MDLGAGARYRKGWTFLAVWYAGLVLAVWMLVAWYFTNQSWEPSDPGCHAPVGCPGGEGILLRAAVIVVLVMTAVCLLLSWVTLRLLLPRLRSGALAGALAAVVGPALLAALIYGYTQGSG